MDEVHQIIGKCVSKSLRNQYNNENVQFMMGISGEIKPLKTMLISPWMVYQLQFTHHRDSTNNLCSMLRTFYKY